MTIRRGEGWGEPVDRPGDLAVAADDAALAALVRSDRDRPLSVSGGDVYRALGAPADRSTMHRLPMDLLEITFGGRSEIAVAHVVARRSWWRGPIVAVMNVDHLGPWLVAPRAHPNDGRFDVLEVDPDMSVRHRLMARQRLAEGAHVPHPAIQVSGGAARDWRFERPVRLWIDGIEVGSCRDLGVVVRPDAYALVV